MQMTKGDGTSLCQIWERNRKGSLHHGRKDRPIYTGEKLVLDLKNYLKRREREGGEGKEEGEWRRGGKGGGKGRRREEKGREEGKKQEMIKEDRWKEWEEEGAGWGGGDRRRKREGGGRGEGEGEGNRRRSERRRRRREGDEERRGEGGGRRTQHSGYRQRCLGLRWPCGMNKTMGWEW